MSASDWHCLTLADPNTLTELADTYRQPALFVLDEKRRSELGQFFTPSPIARFMASMLTARSNIRLLDAGAGVGSLSAACVEELASWDKAPQNIFVTAYEVDALLVNFLRSTLNECAKYCQSKGINFTYQIVQGDFIEKSVEIISGQKKLFDRADLSWDVAILNPPYRKVTSDSSTRHTLRRIGVETSNLYTAFLWLALKLVSDCGEVIAITPRSFCNGPYFLPFRQSLLKDFAFERIHILLSRDQAFRDDEVLQENIIFKAVRVGQSDLLKRKVIVSTSFDVEDDYISEREVPHSQVVQPDDPELFIHVIPDEASHQFSQQMEALNFSLDDLGLTVSTGRVVDFRAKAALKAFAEQGKTVPLIYPLHLSNGSVKWPNYSAKKPNALLRNRETEALLVPSGYYVLVKRFSAKEEKRRVVAAIFDPNCVTATRIGFENHLNYFHQHGDGLNPELAKGLAVFLNSTLVDQYFRQFNGHTQVNATDLRKIKYPSQQQLRELGAQFDAALPAQDEIDRIVMQRLNIMASESSSLNPIAVRKLIDEAIEILRMLNLPREQQNERSALTLLALLNLRPDTPWSEASSPLRGITEIMNFTRDHFGVQYAPNTRETFRRFTMHQFVQSGLVVMNPDKPARPTNSPQTRYQLDSSALMLFRVFGTKDWKRRLTSYIKAANSLGVLRAKEREMQLIPVTLPSGEKVRLSSGGQNQLMKKIIEEFCPRFTPAGIVVYVGDAGQKIRGEEIAYLERLGVKMSEHGKMPDVIVHFTQKDWLVIIEAVTSHGPINLKRHNELTELFADCTAGLVFVTAFETRKAMTQYLREISWQTDVWIAESPTHLIHFNGERFLGPYHA